MRREIVNTMYDNMGVNTHTWLATVVGQGLVIINPIPKVLHLPTKRELSPVEARFVKCVGTSLLASSPLLVSPGGGGGGGTLGISWWGCAAGTLEPTYTRASSAKCYYPILE